MQDLDMEEQRMQLENNYNKLVPSNVICGENYTKL